jgi:hypothetical protein
MSNLFRGINENESFAVFREGLREYLQENLLKTLKKNTVFVIRKLKANIVGGCWS